MPCEPRLTTRTEAGRVIPLLLWRLPEPLLAVSSAPLGGGIGPCGWVLNATVPMSYRRDDPDAHLTEIAAAFGLRGPGVGLLTGVDVAEVVHADDGGVRVWATVGLGTPVWAAAPATAGPPVGDPTDAGGGPSPAGSVPEPTAGSAPRPGTVNIVAYVPARLSPAALVNAVATVTEAKAQAIADLGLAATGTPTDAVCVLCPADGQIAAYGGPRSAWGAPLARAAHRAVRAGGAAFLPDGLPWSVRNGG